jgi:hypothetical protein
MAYDIFPKNEKELRDNISSYATYTQGELILLYRYLTNKFPRTEIPINLDSTKKTSVNITRALQGDITIDKIKREVKITSLSIKFGNGSSGNRGVNNRGNNFEPQFAYDLDQWWQGKNPVDDKVLNAINHLDQTYDLKKSKKFKIDIVGGENTKRPITYGQDIILANPKGQGTDVGASVTDITLTTDDKTIYLSLKLGTTVTFFNVGVRTVLSPDMIKSYNLSDNGGKLLDLFGVDHKLFCDVFNGKLDVAKSVNATLNQSKIKKFLESGIGHGYHIIHKLTGKIVSKKMDETAMSNAAKVGSATIYYGGKGGKGKRIDIEMESPTYKFKLNIRDTQGSDGYPTRLMCDFSYK